MLKVLRELNRDRDSRDDNKVNHNGSPSVKDDVASQADTNPDAMDYDQAPPAVPPAAAPPVEGRESEPPAPRRTGITTINGGSAGASTPATASPPPAAPPAKQESPDAVSVSGAPAAGHDVDMTALELCQAFERQLLELDDLAAFMGGGVAPS